MNKGFTLNYDAPFRTTPISDTHVTSSIVVNEETGHEPGDSLSEHDKNEKVGKCKSLSMISITHLHRLHHVVD
jgi:hypothetical protein